MWLTHTKDGRSVLLLSRHVRHRIFLVIPDVAIDDRCVYVSWSIAFSSPPDDRCQRPVYFHFRFNLATHSGSCLLLNATV